MLTKKSKSGLVAGTAAVAVLLAMSLNIGGLDNFLSIVTGLGLIFLAVAAVAFILGYFISATKKICDICTNIWHTLFRPLTIILLSVEE